jgi:signal transduction histidine kinase/tetratricopeptide (TPR) repeat protein
MRMPATQASLDELWLQRQLQHAEREPDAAESQLATVASRWSACSAPSPWAVELGLLQIDLLVRLWRHEEADALCPRLRDWATAAGDRLQQARAEAMQIHLDVRAGRIESALDSLNRLGALVRGQHEPGLRALHAMSLGRVLQSQGAYERAIVCNREAIQAGCPRYEALLWLRTAHCYRALGQAQQDLEALQRSAERAMAQRDHASACNALSGVAERLIQQGDGVAARAVLAQAEALLPRVPARRAQLQGELLASRAHLLAADQDWRGAAALMTEVIAAKRAVSTRLQIARRLRDLAPWQLRAGDGELAMALLAQAQQLEIEQLREAQDQELQLKAERLEREHAREAQQRAEQHAGELEQANRALQDSLALQRELLDQLVASSRQVALGSLMAGLAHELNTPLGTALTAVSTAQDRARQASEQLQAGRLGRRALQADLDALHETNLLAQRSLERMAALVHSFQDLNPATLVAPPRELLLPELVQQAWQRAVPADSLLRLELTGDAVDAPLLACADELLAVLVELFVNVQRHAGAGLVHLQLQREPSLVRLRVQDDGRGIPAELLPRIFDPYVSTQFGKGRSGMGLFVAQGLVNTRLGGALRAFSEPGQGACFEIEWSQ